MYFKQLGVDGFPVSGEMRRIPVTDAGQLSHPSLRSLFGFWKDKAGSSAAPSRTDFEACELKPWLPHLLLADLIEDRTDIRFRVIGTWVTERVGQDHTGKSIAEIGFTERTRNILDEYLTVADSMAPHVADGPFHTRTGVNGLNHAERLILPLSRDGLVCDKVLSAIYFTE